jgi:ribosomal-protein-alanine N-acetyltransferase
MNDFSAKNSNQAQKVAIRNFEAKFADEIMQIQAETGLSFWAKNDYLKELKRDDSIFKVAQNTGKKIIGFALVRLLIGDSAASFDSSEILNIAVRHSFQNKGFGQMIFDAILCELKRKNISEIRLEVRASNAKAIAFYQKNGFEFQFERKNYYQNPPENAIVLRRQIKRSADTLVRKIA